MSYPTFKEVAKNSQYTVKNLLQTAKFSTSCPVIINFFPNNSYRPPSRGSGPGLLGVATPGKGRSRVGSRLGSTSSVEDSAAVRMDEVRIIILKPSAENLGNVNRNFSKVFLKQGFDKHQLGHLWTILQMEMMIRVIV